MGFPNPQAPSPVLLADEKFHKRTGELPSPLADDRPQTLFSRLTFYFSFYVPLRGHPQTCRGRIP